MSLSGALAVAAGAVLGAWSRWLLGLWLNRPGTALPLGNKHKHRSGGLQT